MAAPPKRTRFHQHGERVEKLLPDGRGAQRSGVPVCKASACNLPPRIRAVLVMPGVDTAGNRTTTLLMIPAVGHYRNGNACTNERARPSSFF